MAGLRVCTQEQVIREDSNVLMIDTVVGLQDESRVADLPSVQIRQPTTVGPDYCSVHDDRSSTLPGLL